MPGASRLDDTKNGSTVSVVWPEESRNITRAVPLPVIAGRLLNRYGPELTSCE